MAAATSAEIFNPQTGRSTVIRTNLSAWDSHAAHLTENGQILLIGDTSVATFNVRPGDHLGVVTTGVMPSPMTKFTSLVLDSGIVFVVGGIGTDGGVRVGAWTFHP